MQRRGQSLRLELLGVGAMASPRYAPAGLLVVAGRRAVMLDGGPGAVPSRQIDDWLVTDARAELMPRIRELARARGIEPRVASVTLGALTIQRRLVRHTVTPTYGYLITLNELRVGWAPEFLEFPRWARDLDVFFADAAGFDRPIWFTGKVGGHACVRDVARAAKRRRIGRLVFAHIGRPTIRAIDAGVQPEFGEYGHDGAVVRLTEPRDRR